MLWNEGRVVSVAKLKNRGFLVSIVLQNFFMFLCRSLFFKLYESPRFLIANNRSSEALTVLRSIAAYNSVEIDIDDMDFLTGVELREFERREEIRRERMREGLRGMKVGDEEETESASWKEIGMGRPSIAVLGASRAGGGAGERLNSSTPFQLATLMNSVNYDTTPPLTNSDQDPIRDATSTGMLSSETRNETQTESKTERTDRPFNRLRTIKSSNSIRTIRRKGLKENIDQWLTRIGMLFVDKWRLTTVLMWLIWGLMSFGESEEDRK